MPKTYSSPIQLVALLCVTVAACAQSSVTPNVDWRIEFACPGDAERVDRVTATISEGRCEAPGSVVYQTNIGHGGKGVTDPGPLGKGPYAFSAAAVDRDGAPIAAGCTTVSLPSAEPVVITLSGSPCHPDFDAGVSDDAEVDSTDATVTAPHIQVDRNEFGVQDPILVRFVNATKAGAPFLGIFKNTDAQPVARYNLLFPQAQEVTSGSYEFPAQRAGDYLIKLVYDANRTADQVAIKVITPNDRDGDGTPDDMDGCPDDTNKTMAGVCGCGTSEADADADETPDCADKCPSDRLKTLPGVCGCGMLESYLDQDGDMLSDCYDECPGDATKIKRLQCGCGVPETDDDGDGTANCIDHCAADANKTEPGSCGCGTPDKDSDSDKVVDCLDSCPNDPLKTLAGACGCGVADTDTDRDQTPDCHDACAADPAKTAAGVCGCGVADTDTDADGTLDCKDLCPRDKNKIAPGECGCGKLDQDSDGDKVLNCFDGCPNDANKTEPLVCGCGVLESNQDGDSALDCKDGCDTDPAKITPGACGCGVVDVDSDGDLTADCVEACDFDPKKTVAGQCGCGKLEPFDTVGFKDAKGYSCGAWKGYSCATAVEKYGYTQAQEDALLANCSKTCNVCPP